MSTTSNRRPLIRHVDDEPSQANFQELQRFFVELYPGVWSKEQTVALITGNNTIHTGLAKPRGRIITYQDAASNLFDSVPGDGTWIINASAPANIRLAFY